MSQTRALTNIAVQHTRTQVDADSVIHLDDGFAVGDDVPQRVHEDGGGGEREASDGARRDAQHEAQHHRRRRALTQQLRERLEHARVEQLRQRRTRVAAAANRKALRLRVDVDAVVPRKDGEGHEGL